jgi:CheY-like chemotaxis protein
MIRPCFLVVDREYASSISTRKLVIETAKFNVITAYSAAEAIETLKLFPNVTGAVLDSGMRDMSCCDLTAGLKQLDPKLTVVIISAIDGHLCDGADYVLRSFDPASLLELLNSLVPEQAAAIKARSARLNETQI